MKVLTQEEQDEHYYATVKGGSIGTAFGLFIGGASVWLAARRFHGFAQTTGPFKAFLVTSTATGVGVIEADRASAKWDEYNNPAKRRFKEELEANERFYEQTHTRGQRIKQWAEENRYSIVFASWMASMAAAGLYVGRNPFLTTQQKLVEARVYAQGATLAVLLASFAFEANDAAKGKGRWETIKIIDPNDPEHKNVIEKKIHHERYAGEDQWKEMVEAEEAKLKEKKQRQAEEQKKKEQQHKA